MIAALAAKAMDLLGIADGPPAAEAPGFAALLAAEATEDSPGEAADQADGEAAPGWPVIGPQAAVEAALPMPPAMVAVLADGGLHWSPDAAGVERYGDAGESVRPQGDAPRDDSVDEVRAGPAAAGILATMVDPRAMSVAQDLSRLAAPPGIAVAASDAAGAGERAGVPGGGLVPGRQALVRVPASSAAMTPSGPQPRAVDLQAPGMARLGEASVQAGDAAVVSAAVLAGDASVPVTGRTVTETAAVSSPGSALSVDKADPAAVGLMAGLAQRADAIVIAPLQVGRTLRKASAGEGVRALAPAAPAAPAAGVKPVADPAMVQAAPRPAARPARRGAEGDAPPAAADWNVAAGPGAADWNAAAGLVAAAGATAERGPGGAAATASPPANPAQPAVAERAAEIATETLGTVAVGVSGRPEAVHVRLGVDSGGAAQRLSDAGGQLERSLAAGGTRLEGLSVDVRGGASDRAGASAGAPASSPGSAMAGQSGASGHPSHSGQPGHWTRPEPPGPPRSEAARPVRPEPAAVSVRRPGRDRYA